jgi:AcrR family transcriptional regulator
MSGRDPATRERVLRTAERLFADRGFKRITVRDICRTARANVAAVNYHFGDKMGLYREVLQQAIDGMREITESARAAGEGQQPEEKLRRYLVIFLRRLTAPGHEAIHRLIQREMHDPTPALDALVDQGVRPRVAYLCEVIGELIGCDPSDPRVLRCAASVQAQSVSYMPNPIASRLGFHLDHTAAHIDAAAHHIAEFSLAGIRAIAAAPAASGAKKPKIYRASKKALRN